MNFLFYANFPDSLDCVEHQQLVADRHVLDEQGVGPDRLLRLGQRDRGGIESRCAAGDREAAVDRVEEFLLSADVFVKPGRAGAAPLTRMRVREAAVQTVELRLHSTQAPSTSCSGSSDVFRDTLNRRILGYVAAAASFSEWFDRCTVQAMLDCPEATQTSPTSTSCTAITLSASIRSTPDALAVNGAKNASHFPSAPAFVATLWL